tara:strand:- start:1173 stop:1400 length:228 start_codon:yes stop_codon:yes gene_type:complete
MSVNKSIIDWLESQEHPVAICVVWAKKDADKHQKDQGLQPLTDDEWDAVVRRLEKGGMSEFDWENLTFCIEEVLK